MTISDGAVTVDGVVGLLGGWLVLDVVVLGGWLVLDVVVLGASVVVVVVLGGSVVVVVVGGSVVVAGGGLSAVVVSGATGCGLGGIDSSVGAVAVDEAGVVAGTVSVGSWWTSRTMLHTSRAIRIAVSTPQPTSANGLRYHGVGGGPGGCDQPGCCSVGSRYSLE